MLRAARLLFSPRVHQEDWAAAAGACPQDFWPFRPAPEAFVQA